MAKKLINNSKEEERIINPNNPIQLKGVTVTAKAPTWFKYKQEWEKENPFDINKYVEDRFNNPVGREAIKKIDLKGWRKQLREEGLLRRYNSAMNYVGEQLVKNKPQGKLSRSEWLNQMSDKEEEIIKRNPKYQSSLWVDTKRGLTSLVELNPLRAFQNILNSSDYTNREKREMLKDYANHPTMSKVGDAAKILNPLTVPSKMVQSTYKDNYSFTDALKGKKNNAGIVEDIVTDLLNFVGAGLVGKLSTADKIIDATKVGSKVLNKTDDVVKNVVKKIDVIKPDDIHNINSNISELERLGIPKGERNQWLKGRTADKAQDVAIGLNNPKYSQSVRDAHFMQSAPENTLILNKDIPLELHHGTNETFTKFDINKTTRGKTEGKGIYSSTEYLPGYGNIDMKLYGYVKLPFNKTAERSGFDALGGFTNNQYWNTDLIDSRIEIAAKNIKNQPMSYKYYSSPELPPFGINKEYLLDNSKKVFKVGEYSKKGYQNYLKNIEIFKERNLNDIIELKGLKNSDGVVINWTNHKPEIVTLPERVKTTSVITYDDLGNIIPLSKRDNFKINDIRYKTGGSMNYISLFKLGGTLKSMLGTNY